MARITVSDSSGSLRNCARRGDRILGTLAGAAVTERNARKRERQMQTAAWSGLLFRLYESAYRRFLTTWAGSTDSGLLASAFEQLQRDALYPPS